MAPTRRRGEVMRVAAVVVNWNGADHLAGCLQALDAQDHDDLEIVVVDNASSDGSAELLRTYTDPGIPRRHPIRVVWNTTNRGFAGGANDGIAATDAVAILTCNPDIAPRPDYVTRVVAALDADPRRGAVQGKLHRMAPAPDGRPVIDTTGHVAFTTRLFRNRGEGEIDRGQYETPGEVFGVSGALALYRRAMLDDVALALPGRPRPEIFDEDLFAFWEDVDLDWRAAMRGWVTWYEPAAVAAHERGGAGPRRTPRVEQLNWQNRLLTIVKCDDPASLAAGGVGFVVTLLLKTAELVLTVPSAFVAALADWRLVGVMRAKRRLVQARATVPASMVVARWFTRFDYLGWVATWWRRVTGVPPGR